MKEKCRVISIEKDIVLVQALITDACINCHSASCAKPGTPFKVHNSKQLAIQTGSIVRIAAPFTSQLKQAITALIIPLCLAVVAYILVPFSEGWRIAAAFTAFVLTAVSLFVIVKKYEDKAVFPHITEIL